MQRDFEGKEARARSPRASESIAQLCSDPVVTRARAELGEPIPCHRCLAYEPDTATGCLFLEQRCLWCDRVGSHSPACERATAAEARLREIAPLPEDEQQTLFPTSDTMERR